MDGQVPLMRRLIVLQVRPPSMPNPKALRLIACAAAGKIIILHALMCISTKLPLTRQHGKAVCGAVCWSAP